MPKNSFEAEITFKFSEFQVKSVDEPWSSTYSPTLTFPTGKYLLKFNIKTKGVFRILS